MASEYPGVIPCAVIGLYLGYTGLSRMWRFGLGTIPAALLILANNYATTGSPFSVSYGANANFPEISSGNAMGFNLPGPGVMLGLLVGEYRGLFFWCPVLLMSLIGLRRIDQADRALAVMIDRRATVLILIQVSSLLHGIRRQCGRSAILVAGTTVHWTGRGVRHQAMAGAGTGACCWSRSR